MWRSLAHGRNSPHVPLQVQSVETPQRTRRSSGSGGAPVAFSVAMNASVALPAVLCDRRSRRSHVRRVRPRVRRPRNPARAPVTHLGAQGRRYGPPLRRSRASPARRSGSSSTRSRAPSPASSWSRKRSTRKPSPRTVFVPVNCAFLGGRAKSARPRRAVSLRSWSHHGIQGFLVACRGLLPSDQLWTDRRPQHVGSPWPRQSRSKRCCRRLEAWPRW